MGFYSPHVAEGYMILSFFKKIRRLDMRTCCKLITKWKSWAYCIHDTLLHSPISGPTEQNIIGILIVS